MPNARARFEPVAWWFTRQRIGRSLRERYQAPEQLPQYDVAEPIPDRLAELLKQLAQLELLKELTQLMDEPDSKGDKSKGSRAGLSGT